jgi:hypothetical protein
MEVNVYGTPHMRITYVYVTAPEVHLLRRQREIHLRWQHFPHVTELLPQFRKVPEPSCFFAFTGSLVRMLDEYLDT